MAACPIWLALWLGPAWAGDCELRHDARWLAVVGETIERSEYEFSAVSGGWSAPNRTHGWRSRLGGYGLELVPRESQEGGGWRFTLRVAAFGRESALRPLRSVMPVGAGNRIELRHDDVGIVEWYVNDRKGLEQGFTIEEPPLGAGPLVIEMVLPAELRASWHSDARAVSFTSAAGRPVLSYGALAAWDASGRPLESTLALLAGRLQIRVNERGAAYPVTVDPLMTSPDWTVEGGAADSYFGFSVASAGDVNGDGYADAIVGAPRYDNGEANEGRAYVYLGSASGLSTTAAWKAESNQANAQLGTSVASAGSVNGDPFDDVIVGAPFYDISPDADRGLALVWYGSGTGLGLDGTTTNADWSQDSGQALARFGFSVASAGDVDGDGFDDVLVGAPQYDRPSANEGLLCAYRGSAAGLNNVGIPTCPANADWCAEGDQVGAQLGYGVASAGRVNADAFSDILVGAPFYDTVDAADDDRGWAFAWYGSAVGPGANGTPANDDWSAGGTEDDAAFGWSVASAGDVDGNGFDEVIIGAPLQDDGAGGDSGFVFAYAGSPGGLLAGAAWSAHGDQAGAQFGYTVASAGDVDSDGYDDLVVGAPFYDQVGADTRGAAFLWHGSPAGPGPPGLPALDNAHWAALGTIDTARFGISVDSAGDVDNDGTDDLIIGAYQYDNPAANEGAAFVYMGFEAPGFLEFGASGDPRRIEAQVTAYGPIGYLPGGQYSISGTATVNMGGCPACARSFSFGGLTVVEDTAANGEPAFRVIAGSAIVDAEASPIAFPGASDLDLDLYTFSLDPSGAAADPNAPGGAVRSGLWWTLPDSLTGSTGAEMSLPLVALEQDLDFSISVPRNPANHWIGPKDYPFRSVPQAGVSWAFTRTRVELGLSSFAYTYKEGEGPGGFAGTCAVTGACFANANDGILKLGWTLNQYAGGGAPPGSIGTPYVERNGLRATLYLTAAGSYLPLFPAGANVTVSAGSSIELVDTEPNAGAITGALQADIDTGALVLDEFDDVIDCTGARTYLATFSGGQLLAGGQLLIGSLTPQLGWTEIYWGGTGGGADSRGFFAGGLTPADLSFYAPGTVARVTGARPTVQQHLLAERNNGNDRGTYAGVNVSSAATTGLDTLVCPEPAPGAHGLSVNATEARLYARKAGVTGVTDGGSLDPPLPFPYMGYDLTLGSYGVPFLDNVPQFPTGLIVERVNIEQPSNVFFEFASPAELLGCGDLGDLGEVADRTEQTLGFWNADFNPQSARFEASEPPCSCVPPGGCTDCAIDEAEMRYFHVSSQARLELTAGNPNPDPFRDAVPMDFAPAPGEQPGDGFLICSDLVPAGDTGSVRNELEPAEDGAARGAEQSYGFDVDLTQAHLLPLNPAAPGDVAARYDVQGEYLFPFYGGTLGCTRVENGALEVRGDCAAAASRIHAARRILGELINLEFDLELFDPLRNPGVPALDTPARFLAKSAEFDLGFLKVPASIKLFGKSAGQELGVPELYLGHLSDLAAYAEARGANPCGARCQSTLENLIEAPGINIQSDLVPSLQASYAGLVGDLPGGSNLRSLVANQMQGTLTSALGGLLPADIARVAERVNDGIDGVRAASGAFKTLNLTGPGTFEQIATPFDVQDFVLSKIKLDADIDILDFLDFKGFAEFNRHTANTADDTEDTVDVTVGAHDVGLGWAIDGVTAKTVQATFRFSVAPLNVCGFDGEVELADLSFGEVKLDQAGLLLGMGNCGGGEYFYVAGSATGKFKTATASAGFFLGKSIDIEPLVRIDPDVAEVLGERDSLTGIYARAEASFPIASGTECFPYNLTAGGGAAFWLFDEGPTFGAKLHCYAHGRLACLVSARADLTLLGGLTGDVWHLAGHGFVAGGIGSCEPGDWDNRRDVLHDDWCLACVLDGEFSTDSESGDFDGDFNGPDCSSPF